MHTSRRPCHQSVFQAARLGSIRPEQLPQADIRQAQCFNEHALAYLLLKKPIAGLVRRILVWHLVHSAPLPRVQRTPFSTTRASCQGRSRLSSRRAGRKTGSTTFHCSSVSSQRPAMAIRRDGLSNSGVADVMFQNVYEMASTVTKVFPEFGI
jgi:hypothetical protein